MCWKVVQARIKRDISCILYLCIDNVAQGHTNEESSNYNFIIIVGNVTKLSSAVRWSRAGCGGGSGKRGTNSET